MDQYKMEEGVIDLDIDNGELEITHSDGKTEKMDIETENCQMQQQGRKPLNNVTIICEGDDSLERM